MSVKELFKAVEIGNLEEVQQVIEAGVPPTAINDVSSL